MKMKTLRWFVTFLSITLLLPVIGLADIRLDGYFIAEKDCPARQSIRRNTNPGEIHLTVNMAYEVISKNKPDATHYRLRIEGAAPQERWAEASCGKLLTDCQEQTAGPGLPDQPPAESDDTEQGPPTPAGPDYLLALSWQPAFCQTHRHKTECRTQTAERYDASHFALHGLWPQPRNNIYCNVSDNVKKLDERRLWEQLPALGLTEATFSDLIETMPGVASFLHRHEWIKHGTCYSTTAEEYYRESILLTDQINDSLVRDLFADNIGQRVRASDVKAKYDTAFGEGAGSKISVRCDDGMISEIWINLRGDIDDDSTISDLMRHAETADPSCHSGLIDAVGF